MTTITSYVFFDIETTGLPWQERNRTKIIELSCVAALRKDIIITSTGDIPPVNKLTFVLNPEKAIHPEVVKLTGLTNEYLKSAPLFKQKFKNFISFLEQLPKPICLVAHNGFVFDYKILLAECMDAGVSLPSDLLCIDSLVGFRKLLKENSKKKNNIPIIPNSNDTSIESILLTDDEDEWPNLNISPEEWQEIDDLCLSYSSVLFAESENKEKNKQGIITKKKKHSIKKTPVEKGTKDRQLFNLSALYKRLLNKEVLIAHRAEEDCLMLLECVIALKEDFLQWSDGSVKFLTDIAPLQRY